MLSSQALEKASGLLEVQLTRYSSLNNEQFNLLDHIEDRIHKMLDRRTPDKASEVQTPTVNDFISAMGAESDKLCQQNRRLEKILSHLNELV